MELKNNLIRLGDNSQIIHIIPGDFDHLTIDIITAIHKGSKFKHKFIIPLFDQRKKNKYKNKFKDLHDISYSIIDENYGTRLFKLFAYLIGFRGAKCKQEAAILRALFVNRKSIIISHFYFKAIASLPIFEKYIWLCWGNTSNIYKSKKNVARLYYVLLKKLIFPRQEIVTLMESDRNMLLTHFNAQEANIKTINYSLDNYKILLQTEYIHIKNQKSKILLGNNTHQINNYFEALNFLSNYKNIATLSVLLSYGGAPKSEVDIFSKKARQIFEDNFNPVKRFFEYEDYVKWLIQFDVYVCNASTQTGLGIIYIMLYLGKKIYIRGYNLEWCQQNDLIVFSVDDLKKNKKCFNKKLSRDEILKNRQQIYNMLNPLSLNKEWDDFYCSLLKKQ